MTAKIATKLDPPCQQLSGQLLVTSEQQQHDGRSTMVDDNAAGKTRIP